MRSELRLRWELPVFWQACLFSAIQDTFSCQSSFKSKVFISFHKFINSVEHNSAGFNSYFLRLKWRQPPCNYVNMLIHWVKIIKFKIQRLILRLLISKYTLFLLQNEKIANLRIWQSWQSCHLTFWIYCNDSIIMNTGIEYFQGKSAWQE